MSMFEKYDRLNEDYIPNNTTVNTDINYIVHDDSLPRTSHNVYGNRIGLTWVHGEEFDLILSAKKELLVAEDSIVYEKSGEVPTQLTKGLLGQQAFNTVDCKSWTCVGISSDMYIWIEDSYIITPSNGAKKIYMCPDMTNKTLLVTIYNHRWEELYSLEKLGKIEVSIHVGKELNEILKPGVYYCTIKVTSMESVEIVNKEMLIVN